MASAHNQIIEEIFRSRYQVGTRRVPFDRQNILEACERLAIAAPKNLDDVIYSFRYRSLMPPAIVDTAGPGKCWIIRPAGSGKYEFVLEPILDPAPRENIIPTKIPNETPGIVAEYTLTDEQSLLARLRYNRLVDMFLGIACYSLKSHLRTAVPKIGQVETDEIYVGLDKKGVHYIVPVQAKGGRDKLSVV